MMRARLIALVALIALGLAACGGGTSAPPTDDDPEPLAGLSSPVIGYPDSDAVAIEGRAGAGGALIALGVLHGFAARLDLELIAPSDIPGGVLQPVTLPGCDLTVTPANLRAADFVIVASPDASLALQLRNRAFGAERLGTEYYGFIIANVDGSIVATCDFGVQQVEFDTTLEAGWNLVRVRTTEYEAGVIERLVATTIDALPEEAAWYVAP